MRPEPVVRDPFPGIDEASVERQHRYLHPGQFHVAAIPCRITTILGSCVAVCLWSPRLAVGGMNHFILPSDRGGREVEGRFGMTAVPRLVEALVELGAGVGDLKAKVFGGACVLDAFRATERHIGIQNVDTAMEWMARAEIPVVGGDVGGRQGRKVLFDTDTGHAWVRWL